MQRLFILLHYKGTYDVKEIANRFIVECSHSMFTFSVVAFLPLCTNNYQTQPLLCCTWILLVFIILS